MGVIIRQSIKGTFVTYVGAFIGFLTTLYVIPKFLGEENYGLTRVILDAGLLFAMIFQLGASQSAIRFFPYFKSEDKKHNGFFFYLMSLVTVGFLLFIPIFFLLRDPISAYFSKESSLFVNYLYWVIPLTFFLLYWLSFEAYSNTLMRIAIPKFIREVLLRLLVCGVYLAYGLGFLSLDGFVTAFVCVYGVAMLTTFIYISRIGTLSLKRGKSVLTPELKKTFLSYTSIITLGSLGSTLIPKIDTFMIAGMDGLAWTGIYGIAIHMVAIVEMPSRSILAISSPIASEALKKGNMKEANALYKKVSLNQLLIGSLIFILLWFNIDNIYEVIPNGETYAAAKWVILFIGIAKLIEITVNFGVILISYSKYYHWTLYFTLFITVITIVLNYLMIPVYGISGAALATLFACILSNGFQQWLIFAKIKANPYSLGTLKLFGVVAVCFLVNYLLPDLASPWLDILYRTFLCGGVFALLAYFLCVSEEANGVVDKFLKQWRK